MTNGLESNWTFNQNGQWFSVKMTNGLWSSETFNQHGQDL
jgi:hypothetical protein